MTRDMGMEAIVACLDNINEHTNDCDINLHALVLEGGADLSAEPYLTTRVVIINDNGDEQRLMHSGTPQQAFWWAKGFLDALGHTGQLVYEPGEINSTEKEVI